MHHDTETVAIGVVVGAVIGGIGAQPAGQGVVAGTPLEAIVAVAAGDVVAEVGTDHALDAGQRVVATQPVVAGRSQRKVDDDAGLRQAVHGVIKTAAAIDDVDAAVAFKELYRVERRIAAGQRIGIDRTAHGIDADQSVAADRTVARGRSRCQVDVDAGAARGVVVHGHVQFKVRRRHRGRGAAPAVDGVVAVQALEELLLHSLEVGTVAAADETVVEDAALHAVDVAQNVATDAERFTAGGAGTEIDGDTGHRAGFCRRGHVGHPV